MKILFIGGCKDGEWFDVDELQQYIRMPNYSKTKFIENKPIDFSHSQVTVELYRQEKIRCEGVDFRFFVLEGISPIKMLTMLSEGYKGNNKK